MSADGGSDIGFVLTIDLTGSTTHAPGFKSVEVNGDWPLDWPPERLRGEAARWAGVPVGQVSRATKVRLGLLNRVEAAMDEVYDAHPNGCDQIDLARAAVGVVITDVVAALRNAAQAEYKGRGLGERAADFVEREFGGQAA